jgi:protein SCO1/2
MMRILVVGLVVLVAAMFVVPRGDRGPLKAATLLPEPLTLPDVALVDSQGQSLHLRELQGQYTLLYFGSTHCPDVCSLTLQALADARAELARRAPRIVAPRVVFVSVDPRRDSAARISAYVAQFDTAFLGATAPERVLEPLLSALDVTVERDTQADGTYNVVHSATVYVLSPTAEWIAIAKGPHDPPVVATDYLKIRQRRPAA